jgi:hypothetical protein
MRQHGRRRARDARAQIIALAASLALLAGCASGGKPADEKPSGREQTLVEMRAVVIGVDQVNRLLALEAADGGRLVLPVAEEFRDFDRARVGDQVVVSHTQAIAWQVKPSDKGAPGVSSRETLSNPRPGEAPGGAVERAITITATITAFDVAGGIVTLTGPQGNRQRFIAHRPADLEKIRIGDLVDITYSEALAVSLRPDAKR